MRVNINNFTTQCHATHLPLLYDHQYLAILPHEIVPEAMVYPRQLREGQLLELHDTLPHVHACRNRVDIYTGAKF